MPGNLPLRIAGTAAAVQTAMVLLSSRAFAAPSPGPTATATPPKDTRCEGVFGPIKESCERNVGGGNTSGSSGTGLSPNAPSDALNPLASLAKGCADAAAWIVGELSKAVNGTANVDFTNGAFLKQYAIVFAASTILTLVLWLFAVAKRAIRGVPFTTAMSEAIGFLWLTVLASAFTPLILYTIVSATDGVTEVIASATGGQTDVFFGSFAEALKKGDDIGGGPIMLIVVALVTVLAAGILCLELVIRAALLYVGALLGTVVYAGLVDRNLWGHVRRWAGIMIAVILVKPVIVIVLGLAGALAGEKGPNAFSAVVSGLSIILLAIFASAMIYRFVPGFGDEIASARTNRSKATDGAQAAAVISSPASLVSQGIKTHSSRGGGGGGGGNSGGGAHRAGGDNQISGGMAAHSSRRSGGGNSGGPAAAPPPRTGSSTRNTGGDGR
ncbi:hypothetical protein OG730_22575 [Streptomyces sp. NBC_01298]|uniref:hypothetical protein n=1 Tax=Streptomyces sp. NBC_01298 TaxID=2903817 RepID=UPI002E103506|nr:hypothetical protein OG730_22575 [Streptomyces sp. NBC_01298]